MGFTPNSANVRREGYTPALIARNAGGTNGPTQTATQTLTIPQVNSAGDYIVITGNNGLTLSGGVPSNVSGVYYNSYAQSTGSTYFEVATTFVFQALNTSATGQQITLSGGGYSFNWHIMTFTNPYKTSMSLFNWNNFWPNSYMPTVTTSQASSLTESVWTGAKRPPVTRIRNISSNGTSGPPNVSFSGSGTTYYNQDSYWWRSSAVNIETDSSVNSTGTVSMNNCAVAMMTTILI